MNKPEQSEYGDVVEFHVRYDLPIKRPASWHEDKLMAFRINHLYEELEEIRLAYVARDMAKFLDGLIDLVYVAIGTAIWCGLPWKKGWAAVHTTNMKKERAHKHNPSKRHAQYDVVKPKGWIGPDIEQILKDAGYEK